MHIERLQLGAGDRLEVTEVGGDLRLAASEGADVRVQVGEEGALRVTREAGVIQIACRAGCLLFVPTGSPMSIGKVAGDLRVVGLQGTQQIEQVGGDLNLRETGAVSVVRVGGDLIGRKLAGRLQATSVDGDAQLEDLQGDVEIGDAGDNIRVRRSNGSLALRAGGDIRLEFSPVAGSRSTVRAGGDLSCVLPARPSLWLDAIAGGDLTLPQDVESTEDQGRMRHRMGSGAAELSLEAGGDLHVRLTGQDEGREEIDRFLEQINASVRDQVERAMAKAASGLPDGAAIARQVEESLRSAGLGGSRERPPAAGRGRSTGRNSDPAENPEQLAILDMLQAGKINSQEAEMLLRALESGA
jgi:hypothetical protein